MYVCMYVCMYIYVFMYAWMNEEIVHHLGLIHCQGVDELNRLKAYFASVDSEMLQVSLLSLPTTLNDLFFILNIIFSSHYSPFISSQEEEAVKWVRIDLESQQMDEDRLRRLHPDIAAVYDDYVQGISIYLYFYCMCVCIYIYMYVCK